MVDMAEEYDGESAVWFTAYDDDGVSVMPEEMPSVPAAFIAKLRGMISTWKSLGLTDWDTGAAFAGGKVWISVKVGDARGETTLGSLRVDVTDTEWVAGWATADVLNYEEFADSLPIEQTGGPITDVDKGVEEAIAWLQEQLQRPVVRREWRSGGEVVARSWRLEDTGRNIVVSGDPAIRSNPDTADEAVQVRP
jgi:hypothetical protein